MTTTPAGGALVRLFDASRHGATATGFRFWGPLHRFDHQRGTDASGAPAVDPERGIYYAALTLSGCLVEVFGDQGEIAQGEYHVARPRLIRDLRLLDLRGRGAMRAGTVAALAKVAERRLSQAWSRYFYEHQAVYTAVDGLIYRNAHNDEDALALYERAQDALDCPPEHVLRLDHRALRPRLLEIAREHSLVVIA